MKEMTLKEIQDISLDILRDVHEFCIANNIKYTLQGGTLLGAIRHKGFIPWDNDIDIAMPRPDYEKFIHSYSSQKGFYLFSREKNDGNDVYIAFSRICDMERTFTDCQKRPWVNVQTGVWIDLFPLDGAEESVRRCKRRIRKMRFYWSQGGILRMANHYSLSEMQGLKNKIYLLIKKMFRPFCSYSVVDKHIKECKRCNYDSMSYYCNFSFLHYGIHERHNKKVLNNLVLMPFENEHFLCMEGYDEALKEKYGDYMQLPPKEKQVVVHGYNKYYWK